jgi:hypothetical protein
MEMFQAIFEPWRTRLLGKHFLLHQCKMHRREIWRVKFVLKTLFRSHSLSISLDSAESLLTRSS